MNKRLLMIAAVLCVVAPFLTWRATWFGRSLNEREMRQYLYDEQRPRRVQHALSQIADRIVRGDSSARKWYPRVAELARHSEAKIRLTAAWAMGQDNTAGEFHEALHRLLKDPDPMVRRNAALALARFGDGAGRAELNEMLEAQAGRTLAPDQAWEALRGLYLVGQTEDLPNIDHFLLTANGSPDRLRKQAALTAQAIRTRGERQTSR